MATRFPTHFIPHGGGPCFFMESDPPETWDKLAAWLHALPSTLPEKPKAIIVISGHWEEHPVAVNGGAHPPLLFDYYGFPPHTYELTYPAPGAPELAARIAALIEPTKIPIRLEKERGLDHGVFVPFKVIFPQAEVPLVQLSLHPSLDPRVHLVLGSALAPLRDEGVWIVGSGMSYHNLRRFRSQTNPGAKAFDDWLGPAVEAAPQERVQNLIDWASAPSARDAQPREDHLVPLFVAAGAALEEPARRVFHDTPWNADISGFRFG
jgi:aromatic ring-opening dioxygenase catalytic subunit (LigB family)